MAAGGTIDLQGAFARMGGDHELYQDVYPLFLRDATRLLERAAVSLAAGQRTEAREAWHTLKGLSGTMGAVSLSKAAEAGERAMEQAASDADAVLLERAREEFAQARANIESAWRAAVPGADPLPAAA